MTTSPARQHLTTDAFYAQYPESNTPIELIEGDVIASPSAVPKRQDVVGSIYLFLQDKTRGSGSKVYVAPLDVRFDETNGTPPDVLLLSPERRYLVGDKRIEGAPDLVVEVISPGSVRMDRVVKFRLYERFGVREYWIADSDGVVEVFTLRDGRFALLGIYESGESFDSPLLGQPVPLASLFDS